MKQTKTTARRSLAVVLSILMLMTSWVFVAPTKAEAATANSYDTLKSAINTANSASGTTTIQLTGSISTGEVAALPTINKNVILDLNGYSITFSYSGNTPGEGDSTEYQLPSELQGTQRQQPNYLDKAMFNVGSSGSLQIINKSGTASTVKCYTKGSKPADAQTGNNRYITTASNLIYATGTVIIGDKSNSSYNNFTLYSQSIARTDSKGTDYSHVHARATALTVTVNSSTAKLFMYGGTVNAAATARGKRDGRLDCRAVGLNIQNAYSAEIYGGDVNILSEEESGIRNSDTTDSDGNDCYVAAIRVNTPNVYIFNVTSSVNVYAGADTNDAKLYNANIWATSSSNMPHIYGAKLTNTSGRASGDTAPVYAYNVLGSYGLAYGGDILSSYGNNLGYKDVGKGSSASSTNVIYTLFYFGDQNTTNGVYPWGYNTFRDYTAAHTSSSDVYFTSSASHMNDSANYSAPSTKNYTRTGYTQTGWTGTKCWNAGTYTSTSNAGLNASNGGSLFLYPTWTINSSKLTVKPSGGTWASSTNDQMFTQNYNTTKAIANPTAQRGGSYGFIRCIMYVRMMSMACLLLPPCGMMRSA